MSAAIFAMVQCSEILCFSMVCMNDASRSEVSKCAHQERMQNPRFFFLKSQLAHLISSPFDL
jgi:hypothetical protein